MVHGFNEETRSITIKHIRSPTLLVRSFPKIYSLQHLRIQKSNVSTIQPGAFSGLSLVRDLSLVENRISRLDPDTFLGLKLLAQLFLDKNVISAVSPHAFRGLPHLATLCLTQNLLCSLPVGALLQPPALATADLRNNRIATIDDDVTRLKQNPRLQLALRDNKLQCGNNLEWFICNLPNLTQISDQRFLKCAIPRDLRGTALSAIRNVACQTDAKIPHPTYPVYRAFSPPSRGLDMIAMKDGRKKDSIANRQESELATLKTVPTENYTEEYTKDMPAPKHTTEMGPIILLGGDPTTNQSVNITYILAMARAVVLPLLFVLATAGVLYIYRCWYDADLADRDQPTGPDDEPASPETDLEEGEKIEPYAVAYADEHLDLPSGNSAADGQPNTTQNQTSEDSDTIQPYAVAYDEDTGPEIQPYAVAYKEDLAPNDDLRIPLYGQGCPDPSQDAGGNTKSEADSTPQENNANQPEVVGDLTKAGSTPLENNTHAEAAGDSMPPGNAADQQATARTQPAVQQATILAQPAVRSEEEQQARDGDVEPACEDQEAANGVPSTCDGQGPYGMEEENEIPSVSRIYGKGP